MPIGDNQTLSARITKMRRLCDPDQGSDLYHEAASLGQTVLYDTVGGAHPLMEVLRDALKSNDWGRAGAGARAVIALFDEGTLRSPRLLIAHEIEGDLLGIAQNQTEAAEKETDLTRRGVYLAVAAFLAGASLEDALRRLCDAHTISYDSQRTSISRLQGALYQPSKQIEVISRSETKQVIAWGDTRNKADHGNFGEITLAEVVSMVVGVRGFIDKHLA